MSVYAALAGAATHVFYFNHGEHDHFGLRYLLLFITTILSHIAFLVSTKQSFRHATSVVFPIYTSWLGGIYTSLLIYRAFLNPLNKFPGPSGARISGFCLSSNLKDRNLYRKLHEYHTRYGPFLRIGPTDLSITNPKAMLAIHGHGTACSKGAPYDITGSFKSLQALRDKAQHDQRRRLWSAVFGDKALRGYEQRIRIHQGRFIDKITAQQGASINITDWCMWYSFDVMGDLAFGHHFGMMESGKRHWTIQLLFDSIHYFGYMLPVWVYGLLMGLPGLSRDYWRFMGYCQMRLDERMKRDNTVPDIYAGLLAPYKDRKPTRSELDTLLGDTHLIIIAGSDTVAVALASALYLLCRHPEHIKQLRDELSPFISVPILHDRIAQLEHLNGVISEALRLFPPTPTEFRRLTPPEGITVDGTFIPGNTNVQCPLYVLGRSEEIYRQAEKFIPERWYKYPEMVKERTAFAPFSAGRYSCIGKPVALMNLRTTLARLIHDFDFGFAPGEDGNDFTEKAVEHVTFSMGRLDVVFTRRIT
ncbi:cytochrome P450 [Aspergillus cavernicola]|uniref:Cytochrome P450 n=1 Tax=Aspergillus cavernicola TaxID=176166 RepID=A0ABR4I9A7_9EURO